MHVQRRFANLNLSLFLVCRFCCLEFVVVGCLLGTLSSQDEFVDDDERRRVRSRSSSKAGKTNLSKLLSRIVAEVGRLH